MTTAFTTLGLCPGLVQTVTALGYTQPTPIQARAIPELLAGRDVLGRGVLELTELLVRFGQLEPRLAEPRILLNRFAIFNRGFPQLLLRDVLVAALEVLPFEFLRIFRARHGAGQRRK